MTSLDSVTKHHLRTLLLGDGLVSFGGWIDYIAILTLSVFRWKADSYGIALIGAATLLPGILLAKPIGRLVNGHHVLHWLRASLLLRTLCTGALLLAGSLPVFIVLAVIRALFNSMAIPGITVLSARAVPESERTRYYSVLNMLNSLAKMSGPALGSAIAALGSEEYTLMFSGMLTLAGLGVFCLIPASSVAQSPVRGVERAASTERLGGLNWYAYAAVMLVYFATVFMVNNQLPVMLNTLQMNKGVLGMLVSASGIGNFLYGFWSAKRSTRKPLTGILSELLLPAMGSMVFFMLIAGYFVVWSASLPIEPLLVLFFLIGTFSARFAISANVYLATHFSGQLGPASGQLQSVQNAAMLLAPFAGAFVLSHTSVWQLFLLSGVLGLLGLSSIRLWVARVA